MSLRAWLLDHWRLKLLAAFLALVLFAAVAFAENPVISKTITVPINEYQNESQDVMLVHYPKTVDVQIVGAAAVVNIVKADDFRARMDLTGVKAPGGDAPPVNLKVPVNVQTTAQNVTLQQNSIPAYVTVDRVATAQIPLEITSPTAPGFTIDKTIVVNHATQHPATDVSVTGPASLLNGLSAFVNVGTVGGSLTSNDLPVKFKDAAGRTLPWPPATIPLTTVDVSSVDIAITGHETFQQKVVSLLQYPTGSPACGYQISAITITPNPTVTVTGTVGDLGKVTSLTLPPVDINGATANVSQRVPVPTPAGLSSLQVAPTSVVVTIEIRQGVACTPASPIPTPSPSATP